MNNWFSTDAIVNIVVISAFIYMLVMGTDFRVFFLFLLLFMSIPALVVFLLLG